MLKFPMAVVDADGVVDQRFPFRLFTMILTLIVLFTSSLVYHFLFRNNIIPRRLDVANAFGSEDIAAFEWSKMVRFDGMVMLQGAGTELDGERNGACALVDKSRGEENGNGDCEDEKLVDSVVA